MTETAQESNVLGTFLSPTENLRLVDQPTRRVQDLETGDVVLREGKAVEFVDGRKVVTDDDPEGTLEFLQEHPENGRLFYDADAGRVPDGSATIEAVIDAAVDGDTDRIVEIYVAEQASHSRPEVLAACKKALERADALPEPAPRPEHEIERVRREPATGISVPPVDHPGPPSALPDEGQVGEVSPPPAPAQGVTEEAQAAQAQPSPVVPVEEEPVTEPAPAPEDE